MITSAQSALQMGLGRSDSVLGCLLFDVQFLRGCLEERGDEIRVLCSCWGGLTNFKV